MIKLQRFVRKQVWIMVLVVPFWLLFVRLLFGVGGWGLFLLAFSLPPILLMMLVQARVITKRADVKATGLVTPLEGVLLSTFYVSILLFGFFLADGGDTVESYKSLASMLFGRGFLDASSIIAIVMAVIAVVAFVVSLLCTISQVIIVKRQRGKRPTSSDPKTR